MIEEVEDKLKEIDGVLSAHHFIESKKFHIVLNSLHIRLEHLNEIVKEIENVLENVGYVVQFTIVTYSYADEKIAVEVHIVDQHDRAFFIEKIEEYSEQELSKEVYKNLAGLSNLELKFRYAELKKYAENKN